MAKSQDFAASVKHLGGNDEDVQLLQDTNVDGSDIEGAAGPADPGLAQDVVNMWKELSRNGKKTKFTDNQPTVPVQESGKSHVAKDNKQDSPTNNIKVQNKLEKRREKKQDKPAAPASVAHKEAAEMTEKTSCKVSEKPKARKQLQAINDLVHPDHLILDNVIWYDFNGNFGTKPLDPSLADDLKAKAASLLARENAIYAKEAAKSREHTASIEFLRHGTFSDQLGTLSILATESPLHSIKYMEMLLSKCEIKNKESACKALEVTKDLLVSHVLPERRLKWFNDQNLTIDAEEAAYMVWAFEDWLKNYYFKLLQVIERLLSDTVENIRLRALHVVFDLFQAKPEQEMNLLRLGINKLGDSAGKVASRVKKLLMDCLQVHPNMKPIVATAISEALARTPEYRLRYYAVDTLCEFILSQQHPELANQLVLIYLNLFERLLAEWNLQEPGSTQETSQPKTGRRPLRGKKGGLRQKVKTEDQVKEEQNARLVAKIFTGLNRAFPFSQIEPAVFNKYIDTLYKMSHSPNTGTFIEALSFIFQIAQAQQGAGVDRYFRTLYESLLDLKLCQSSKISKYLHLLLKSVAADTNEARSLAFAKRIVQTADQWPEVGAVAGLLHDAAYVPHVESLLDTEHKGPEEYDIRARNPEFAKAATSKLWELLPLLRHYHPTVTLYAESLLERDGKPLDMPSIEQHTVNSFLSKWSYKKPKEKENTRGGSIFQPLSGYTDLALRVKQEGPQSTVPIPIQDWKNRTADQVAPDERFFLEYFSSRPTKQSEPKKKPAEDEGSDDEEDEVFNAIMSTNPDERPSDDELGFSDMDDDDGEDDAALVEAFKSDSQGEGPGEEEGEFGSFESGSDLGDAVDEDLEEDLEQDSDGEPAGRGKSDKKRKREWAEYPTFMDADAFEDIYSKKSKK